MDDRADQDKRFDVLGLGAVAVDDLVYVPSYPPADVKMPIQRRRRCCGGLTGVALIAAARLGAGCAYAGTLGEDELSAFVIAAFEREGVDVTHLMRRREARPVHATIVVDTSSHTRNIFYDAGGVTGAAAAWPAPEVIRSARILFVDYIGTEGMIRAAGIARAAGMPVVGDFESIAVPRLAELLDLVDHLIIPRQFAAELTGRAEPPEAAAELWREDRNTVVITDGARGCWYLTAGEPPTVRHEPAVEVEVVDTTGCGDVFHGAYAAGLARGLATRERIRFATAAAALKAAAGDELPDRPAVDAILNSSCP